MRKDVFHNYIAENNMAFLNFAMLISVRFSAHGNKVHINNKRIGSKITSITKDFHEK